MTVEVSPINGGTIVPLVDGATISWDCAKGRAFSVTLGGNRSVAAPSGVVPGERYYLFVTQDGTGSRTLSFAESYKFPSGELPGSLLSSAANTMSILEFIGESATQLCYLGTSLGVAPVVAPPTNLVAVLNGANVDLTWEDNSSAETGFRIEFEEAGSPNVWTGTSVDPAANAESFQEPVADLIGPGTYTFRIAAKTPGGGVTSTVSSNTVVVP